jgi:hypothetical protein
MADSAPSGLDVLTGIADWPFFELAHSVRRQLWVESGRQPPSLYSQYRIVTLPEVVSNHPPAE